jgi:hypothetical protein
VSGAPSGALETERLSVRAVGGVLRAKWCPCQLRYSGRHRYRIGICRSVTGSPPAFAPWLGRRCPAARPCGGRLVGVMWRCGRHAKFPKATSQQSLTVHCGTPRYYGAALTRVCRILAGPAANRPPCANLTAMPFVGVAEDQPAHGRARPAFIITGGMKRGHYRTDCWRLVVERPAASGTVRQVTKPLNQKVTI